MNRAKWHIVASFTLAASLFNVVSCKKETPAPTPKAESAPMGSPTPSPEIVVNLLGVIGLYNPEAPKGDGVIALIPKNRDPRPARTKSGTAIPAHYPFVRFPIESYVLDGSTRSIDLRFTHRGDQATTEYGVVLLSDRSLTVTDIAQTPFHYDRYWHADDPTQLPEVPQGNGDETEFYWVTKMSSVCSKKAYRHKESQKLVDIRSGVLSAVPPIIVYSFLPYKELAKHYQQAIAQGVSWRLQANSGDGTYSLELSDNGGRIRLRLDGRAVDIGNYPLEDIVMVANHDVPNKIGTHETSKNYVDHHFELTEDFFSSGHNLGPQIHLPHYVRDVPGTKTRVGPSCAPVSLP